MKLSIVIVNTNEWKVLRPCLESVHAYPPPEPFEVIVVDNASTDGSREHIARQFPSVVLVANPANLGFAAANNRGIRVSRGELVLLLNPDTVVHAGGLAALCAVMDQRREAGVVGCRLVFPDGTLQRTVRTFPSVWNLFCDAFFLTTLLRFIPAFSRYYLPQFDYGREQQVDWVIGAAFLIRRSLIDRIGVLDEQFYMYTEEVDYCYRAVQNGFQVWYTPSAEIVHFWGGMNAFNRRVITWSNASMLLFFQKHFRGISRAILSGLLIAGMALRVAAYALLGIFTFDRRYLYKARCFGFAVGKLSTRSWKYRRGYEGPVDPWPVY